MTRRSLTLLLVPLGVVLAHVAAYVLPHHESVDTPDHHHLAGLAIAAVLAAAIAIGLVVVGAARGQHIELSLPSLALAQGGAYLALEVAEGVASHAELGQVVARPTLWSGLALQLVVAAILRSLLQVSAAVGRRFAPPRRHSTPRTSPVGWSADPTIVVRPVPSPASRRGPPARTQPVCC